MNYRYVAFNQSGQRVEGQLDVPSEVAAEEMLWGRGLTVARLMPARSRPAVSTLFPTFFGVKRRDLIIFSRQLATLLTSGINILSGLRLLAEQSTKQALQRVLQDVMADLQRGQSFSAALAAHPQAFPELYVSTIAASERTGGMEEGLRQLADYLEREETLTRKLTSALAYPIFVLLVAVGVVILMLTMAIPPMVELIETFGGELPLTTRILIAISRFTSAYGLYLLAGIVLLVATLIWWGSRPSGRRLRDAMILRVPMVGRIILYGQLARFAHTVSVLIRAGLPLAEVMELVLQIISNVQIQSALERARVALLSGQGLSAPLAAESVFPSLLAQMVRVGEESGTLEGNLETLSTFYEEEADRSTQLLTSMIEPALTIFIGLIVGFIAVAMIMPMYSLLSQIK